MGAVKGRTIRKKISMVLLTLGLFVLGISVCVSYIGMAQTKEKSIKSSKNLGDTAANNTKEALIKMANNSLMMGAKEKAALSNEKLEEIRENVALIADYLSDIYQNPNNYGTIHIDIPLLEKNGEPTLQFSHMTEITYEAVKQEAEKAGMFYEIAKHIYKRNEESISSIYYGSSSGFMISYDKNSGLPYKDSPEDPSLLKDYVITEKKWYEKAVEEEEATLIETYYDAFDRLVLSCSAPVWNANHEVAGVLAMDILIEDINKEIISFQIGTDGYAMLINENGQIISGPGLIKEANGKFFQNVTDFSPGFIEILPDMQKGNSGLKEIEIFNEAYYMAYAPVTVSDWTLVTVIPKQEVIEPALDSYAVIMEETQHTTKELEDILKYMAAVFIIVCIGLVIGIFLLTISMSNKIAMPIKKLTSDVKRISEGDLEYRTEIKTGDEIELLGDAFNHMTASLKDYIVSYARISADKERIATELNVATAIQKNMLPEGREEQERYKLFADMYPAKEVGGDFYDYFVTGDGALWIVIADVSGKGVPAALFMVIAKTLIKNQANYTASPGEVLKNANNQLCENNEAEMFVTAFIARYDFNTGVLEYGNAGHNRPLVCKKGECFQWLTSSPGFVLAGFENMEYATFAIPMHSGDRIVLYTDGVTEALNSKKELYGEERLIEKLNTKGLLKTENTADIVSGMKEDIEIFADGAEQADDITIMALEII